MKGVPLNPPSSDKYASFGKYRIDTSSLNQNVLRLVYSNSKKTVPKFNQIISRPFAQLLRNVLETGILSETTLQSLPKEEQSLFRNMCKYCEVDKALSLPTDPQEKADIERFDILRGELIAGNTSREIIRELKLYILKFQASGAIPRSKAMDLLCTIACIE